MSVSKKGSKFPSALDEHEDEPVPADYDSRWEEGRDAYDPEAEILTVVYKYTEVGQVRKGWGQLTPLEAAMVTISKDMETRVSNAAIDLDKERLVDLYEFTLGGLKHRIDVSIGGQD